MFYETQKHNYRLQKLISTSRSEAKNKTNTRFVNIDKCVNYYRNKISQIYKNSAVCLLWNAKNNTKSNNLTNDLVSRVVLEKEFPKTLTLTKIVPPPHLSPYHRTKINKQT